MDSESELPELVRQIVAGNVLAEEEIVRRYLDGVSIIIGRIVQNPFVAEDISQETFIKVIEKVRHGDVREPERLSGFICGVARYLAIEYVRKVRQSANREDVGAAEHLPDPAPDPFTNLLAKEREAAVREVINELQVKRDRELLLRYYIGEEPKDQICSDLGLSREQFNRVVFRALKRFKEKYLKLADERRRRDA